LLFVVCCLNNWSAGVLARSGPGPPIRHPFRQSIPPVREFRLQAVFFSLALSLSISINFFSSLLFLGGLGALAVLLKERAASGACNLDIKITFPLDPPIIV
jgi:hypothetical protein